VRYLYAIAEREGGRVKIGRTTKLNSRIKGLQVGSADRLELLAASSRHWVHERVIHHALRRFRIGGEWFSTEVTAAIREAVLLESFSVWLDEVLSGKALLTRIIEYPIATSGEDLCRVLVREDWSSNYAKK
jgi:hypothetical protein